MKKIHYSSPVDKLITYKIIHKQDHDHDHGDCGHDHDHGDCGHDHDHGDCGHDHHDHDHDHGNCGHDHGDCGHDHDHVHRQEWDNYLELGFKKEHAPELIKMLFDYELHNSDYNTTEVWAPIHALRTLGQLQAEEAVEPIIKLLEKFEDDDWIFVDAVNALVKIGKSSLPSLAKILKNTRKSDSFRMACCSAIQKIGTAYDDQREICAAILRAELENFKNNSRFLNGLIVSDLLTLNESSAFPVIKKAFEANCIFNAVCGDLEDIEIAFGFREKRATEAQYEDIANFGKTPEKEPSAIPPKIGRNDPCLCGSGKKYKKCCINK